MEKYLIQIIYLLMKVLMNGMKMDLLALIETKLDSSFNHDSAAIAGYNQ